MAYQQGGGYQQGPYGGQQAHPGYGQQPQGYGGYAHQQPQQGGDPATQWFHYVAGGAAQVGPEQLQRALIESGMGSYRPGQPVTFSLDTARIMVNMLDRDKSGALSVDEFTQLWTAIDMWKSTFRNADTDNSGYISEPELRTCLVKFGYNMSESALKTILARYSRRPHGVPEIPFDDFIACIVRVRTLTESFRRYDARGVGEANLRYDDFMRISMSC